MRYLTLAGSLMVLCCLGCADKAVQTTLKPDTTFAIHTVAAEQGEDTKSLTDPDSGDVLNLAASPVITATNVLTATVTSDGNGSACLEVTVDEPGAAQLRTVTAVSGKQIAIVVNGRIASAPTIRTPIDNAFQLSGGAFTRTDWEQIVQ